MPWQLVMIFVGLRAGKTLPSVVLKPAFVVLTTIVGAIEPEMLPRIIHPRVPLFLAHSGPVDVHGVAAALAQTQIKSPGFSFLTLAMHRSWTSFFDRSNGIPFASSVVMSKLMPMESPRRLAAIWATRGGL